MKLKKLDDGWWIDDDGELYGPYTTKREAEDDKRGLTKFYANEHRARYVSVESKRTRRARGNTEDVE